MMSAQTANAALTAMVDPNSIYPQSPRGLPAWPFTRMGSPSGTPISGACVDGDEILVAVHSYAKPRYDVDGAIIETAEDHADRIGRAVMRALDRRALTLDGGGTAKVRRTGFQLLPDGAEPDAYHHVANFRVRVIS